MLKLYYSKGSSAIAAHILLEEVGATYEAIEVSIADGAHRSPEFLARNPKGRIPVLETPDGVITENPAILEYIAATHPGAGMLPSTPFEQAQARSLAAYICATVHVAFAHHKRGARWAKSTGALDEMRLLVPKNLRECATYLEAELALSPWVSGSKFGFCDPYLFLLDGWLRATGSDLTDLPRLTEHNRAMRARPAVQQILAIHSA
ncbi:MAG: glutathione S-transferase family protein [Arenibacterium sp.]